MTLPDTSPACFNTSSTRDQCTASKSELRRCRRLLFRNPAQDVHDGLISFASLRREARHDVAEIRAHERRLLVDRARQEALAEGTEWHEPDAELLQGGQQFFFRAPPPQ